MDKMYFSGTSGIVLPYKNRSFYPENLEGKSRLAICSLLFNSLEINSSFYKIPRIDTVRRWGQEVSDGFRFTFKLWEGITHVKGLAFDPNDVARFMEVIAAVEDHKGCLLVQLPPSVNFSLFDRLCQLLEAVRGHDINKCWHVCVEFRHPSWYCQETIQMLDGLGMAAVIHDKSSSGFQMEYTHTAFIYVRFHGPDGDYRGSYDDAVLRECSHYIKDWLAEGKEVFTYFNNTMGDAISNLYTLENYVNE
jgi:uncharacterized protein YecE (DUF72 family)